MAISSQLMLLLLLWCTFTEESNMGFRLPHTFTPLHYVIRLVPHIFPGNFTFDGQVDITGIVPMTINNIVLHSDDMQITSIKVNAMMPYKKIPISSTSYNSTTQMYTIQVKELLIAGSLYGITIKYIGNLRDDMYGFYRTWYNTPENKTRWIAATQLQPSFARRVFPCFDEPALKAKFQINIARTPDMHSISNMPLDNSLRGSLIEVPGRVWDHFATTPRMSTYVIGIVVSDFKGLTQNGSKFISWSQGTMTRQTALSLKVSPSILQAMENFTSIAYQLPKMEQVAIPDFDAGAMENWGIVTYRERLLLNEKGMSSSEDKQTTVGVISHEFAHMWFGNLVTPNWWTHLWLSEGFASYFSYYLTDQVFPQWRIFEQFVFERSQPAMLRDSSTATRVISNDKNDFDIIDYDKAGSVIRQMEHVLTHSTFRKGLQKYLKSRQYMDAKPDDLFHALNEAQKEDGILPDDLDMKSLMETWILQAGFPVIHVTRSKDAINIRQERFLYDRGVRDNTTWWVPISYTTSDNPVFEDTKPRAWLKGQSEMRLLNGLSEHHWIILNIQATGYYRVNYDELTWNLLTRHLYRSNLDSIPPTNRGQLISDAFNLARAGLMNYSKALDLSRYLCMERDIVPWTSFLNVLPHLYRQLYRTKSLQPFKYYVLELLEPLIWKATNKTTTGHLDNLLLAKAMKWACKFEHPDCIAMATTEFLKWSADTMNYRINADMKSVVLCTALKRGGEREFNQVFDYYLNTAVATEKITVLLALACSGNPRYLNKVIEGDGTEVRMQDMWSAFAASWSDPSTVSDAINFIKQNLGQIIASRNTKLKDAIGSMYSIIARHITKPEEIYQLEKILESAEDKLSNWSITSARHALNEALKNLEWNKQYVNDIQQWLLSPPE